MIFNLFANCIPVKGARRSIICDIQRGDFKFIPNALYELLTIHKGKTLSNIKAAYNNEYNNYIDEYFKFLQQHEFGFWSDEPEAFPPINLDWEHTSIITNAIVDVDAHSDHNYIAIAAELDELDCKALQLRVYDGITGTTLENMLIPFKLSRLRSIELMLKFIPSVSLEALNNLCEKNQRISSIIVHSAPFNQKNAAVNMKVPILYSTEEIKDHSHCGVVNPSYFVVNITSFMESINHNNCLNRKISIDIKGNIKNCPSLPKSYGNIKDGSLKEAIQADGFTDFWSISKDQIEICCDCEFRYICLDCRAFLKQAELNLSKPLKCNYDPYSATWLDN